MTEATILNDLLKNSQSASDPKGLSALFCNSNGELSKVSFANLFRLSLNNTETAKSTMSLKSFIEKYIQGRSAGCMLTDTQFYDSAKWFVKLQDGCEVSPQDFAILLTKTTGNVNGAWCCFSFLMMPCRSSSKMYTVSYSTAETAEAVTIQVKTLTFADI